MVSNGSMWTVPDFRGKAQGDAGARRQADRDRSAAHRDRRARRPAPVHPARAAMRSCCSASSHTLFAERARAARPARDARRRASTTLAAAVAEFSPERVAARCGIAAADDPRARAHSSPTTERAAVYGRIGTCTQEYGTLASWLVDVDQRADRPPRRAGRRDVPEGGGVRGEHARHAGPRQGHRDRPAARAACRGAPEVFGEFPMGCLAEEIETPGDGQIRALDHGRRATRCCRRRTGRGSPRRSTQLELMVSVDIYLNETTRHADVILPGLLAARGRALRRRVPAARVAQHRALQPAGAVARRPAIPPSGRSCCG